MRVAMTLAAALMLAGPAAAEVVAHSPQGFVVSETATVAATPDRAYRALGEIGRWWDGEHSLSGNAANLSLEPHIGGCLCEALPDGGHVGWMLVTREEPGKALWLRGALGPLATEGADGTMVWSFKAGANGATLVQVSYLVGGFPRPVGETYAGPVNEVLGDQLKRLKSYLETGPAH